MNCTICSKENDVTVCKNCIQSLPFQQKGSNFYCQNCQSIQHQKESSLEQIQQWLYQKGLWVTVDMLSQNPHIIILKKCARCPEDNKNTPIVVTFF